ncbi:MAG: glycerol-3-phosphate 1-O-acyltransferase PlsY [Vulcanimicrobiaceae bacterium]
MNDPAAFHAIDLPPHWVFPLMWTVAGWPYLLFAFLVGSIPFGLLVGRIFFATDIRASGSGNIGAANALRTFGKKAGAAVLLLDAAKGAIAVLVAWHLWLHVPLYIAAYGAKIEVDASTGPIWALLPLAGVAAVLGHCFSPWLRMRGGKGVATYLGAACVLSPASGLAFVAVWLGVVIPTGFASLGSILGTLAAGAMLVATGARYGDSAFVFAFGSALVVVWKHRENLGRLRARTENRLTLFKR